jgi:hypothetical protein
MDDLMAKSSEDNEPGIVRCPLEECGRTVLYCPRYSGVIRRYLPAMLKATPAGDLQTERLQREKYLHMINVLTQQASERNFEKYFSRRNFDILSNPRCHAESEEPRILELIAEYSIKHYDYMELNSVCPLCSRDARRQQRCHCKSPLDFVKGQRSRDTDDLAELIHSHYQPLTIEKRPDLDEDEEEVIGKREK